MANENKILVTKIETCLGDETARKEVRVDLTRVIGVARPQKEDSAYFLIYFENDRWKIARQEYDYV